MSDQRLEGALPDFDSVWEYENPAATEKRFREILPLAEASQNPSYHAELLTQIARAEGLQRKFEAADRTLNRAEVLLSNAGARAKIRLLLERGRLLNSSGKVAESKPFFVQACELARDEDEDFYAIDAAHMIAIIESADHKLEWNRKALDLVEKSQDPRSRKWKGSLCNNIGWDCFDSKEYNQALDSFRKALKAREEEGDESKIRIAQWCIAKTLRVMGRVEEALEMQRKLLSKHERSETRDGYVYEELGECLLILGRKSEAGKFLALAYEELSRDSWLQEKESGRLSRLKELSSKTNYTP